MSYQNNRRSFTTTFAVALLLGASLLFQLSPPHAGAVGGTYTFSVSSSSSGGTISGGGTLTSNDGKVNCSAYCTYTYDVGGPPIVLHAQPASGKILYLWKSNANARCQEGSAASSTCTVDTTNFTAGNGYSMEVLWKDASAIVSVMKQGSGSGTVSGSGFNCGATCAVAITSGATINLTATPSAGSVFVGWMTGDYNKTLCALSNGKGTLSVNPSTTCSASVSTLITGQVIRPEFALAPASTGSTPGTSTQQTTTTQTQTQTQQQPSAQISIEKPISELKLSDKLYDEAKKPSFDNKASVTLEGKTFARATVKLYIYSTLREVTVTANEAGVWKYAISGLEAGDHRVEAEVTDPASGKTSSRSVLARFTVTGATANANSDRAKTTAVTDKTSNPWVWVILGLVAAAVISTVIALFIRKRRRATTPPASPVV